MKKIAIILFLISSIILQGQVHTMKESIFFGLGKTSLSREHKAKLDSIVLILETSQNYSGEVKGYTCNIGSISLNKTISNIRALNVYNYLVDKGIKRENFTYMGYGESNPIASNATASGRARNRRADIELLLNIADESTSGVVSEFTGYQRTKTNGTNSQETSSSEESGAFKAVTELGPEFTSGKIAAATSTLVKSTNGIQWEIDKNTFITQSKSEIDADFKDYTRNGDIMKKGLTTKNTACTDLKMVGAFNVNFTQEYQDLAINPNKPLKVYIPAPKDDMVQLYSNHKNWTPDTINQLSYDEERQSYVVSVVNNSQMIALMRPLADTDDTVKLLCVKIKGLSPDLIRPYIIYDDCTIAQGCRMKGKKFVFPITKNNATYRLRAAYTDYSQKNAQPYSLNHDITNISPNYKIEQYPNIKVVKYPTKVSMTHDKLPVSSLCETEAATMEKP